MVTDSITISHDGQAFELPQPLGIAWRALRHHRRDLRLPDELRALILANCATGLPTGELESTLRYVLGRIADARALLTDTQWREQVLDQLRGVSRRGEVPTGWSVELAACIGERLDCSVDAPTRSVEPRPARASRSPARHRRRRQPSHRARNRRLLTTQT